jgi:lysyl-tRNA synthetase, class I
MDKNEKKVKRTNTNLVHWTDITAEKIIREKGDKESYVIASGITPSGIVHVGNFREIITVDLVKRALEKKGKKVRFIYSWDNYDVFRKVPKDMPKQELLHSHLRKAIVDVPDVYGCHKSYAEHNQAKVEADVVKVGINPEFIYQSEKYRNGDYVKEIKKALENTEKIKKILNNYREEPLSEEWLPVTMFCEICGKDTIKLKWLEGYIIKYNCDCGHSEAFDFKKKPLLKLLWRIDWPARWAFEKVDFEPGGKEHSTTGGSFDTGKQIVKEVYNFNAPTYVKYDFIKLKGGGGKMSSSKGGVVDLGDVLEIYQPEIVRWLFAGTRPNKEFAISFDADVIKIYEDYDKCERIYFGEHQVNEKEKEKQKVAYELSAVKTISKTMPYQPGFRHLTTLLQIHSLDTDKVISYYEKELNESRDRERVRVRTECAKNWLNLYAPEEFKFTVQEEFSGELGSEEKKLLHQLAEKLKEKSWTDVELHEEIYILCTNNNFPPKDFFKLAYGVLINKDKGPRLASFILAIGKEKVSKLFEKV